GLQASWAAALVKGVSEVRLEVPWCCDLGGREVGRMGGWRPKWHPTLGYYDPVNMAKRFPKEMTKTVARSALGDYIAPPCGHAVLFNAMKGKKSVEFVQGGDHYGDPEKETEVAIVSFFFFALHACKHWAKCEFRHWRKETQTAKVRLSCFTLFMFFDNRKSLYGGKTQRAAGAPHRAIRPGGLQARRGRRCKSHAARRRVA
ncbi:MAG: acetylxylan esterase, partial [Kiritimatiellae bacterium]|nr:acetylxylan esterase [Kiritimatiellia bacterium]